jgi:argininosuccinate lyase
MSAQTLGRVSKPPHPVLFQLLYEPGFLEDRAHVLPCVLEIDAAHVVMLARKGLLPATTASRLLAVNRGLKERLARGEELFPPPPSHRGLYLLYESEYIARLGPEVGGSAHVARSRNDINATVTRMRLRGVLLDVLQECAALQRVMGRQASAHRETLMSGFTHLQPAQPSSLGHYLAAVLSELTRSAEWLSASYESVDCSPMGAAAGLGTAFPVDREGVARLLGFPRVIANSIDAVGSRDYVIQVLSALAMLGSTLTRLATDLQAWGSNAYGFLSWPDELVSTSSIMPQKRNAFVLENIRGKAVRAAGALTSALMGLKSAPFTNSVEVSSEVTSHLWPALESARTALRLMALLLEHLEVHPERMREFLDAEDTTMTALADLLVARQGLAFRTAHEAVSRLVGRKGRGALSPAEAKRMLEESLASQGGRLSLDEEEVARVLEPEGCMKAARYGGGPAPETVQAQLEPLEARRRALEERVAELRARLESSERELERAAREVQEAPRGVIKAGSLLELMKNTPLVALRGRAKSRPRARLWGKLELAMPGQMKDRVALKAIEDAEAAGILEPGAIIVESSSGTMAEGLARVGSLKGYRVIIVTDPRIDTCLSAKLKALGARVEVVDKYHPEGGWQYSRLERLREVLAAHPGAFWPRQYDNPSNAAAYSGQMVEELLSALGQDISVLVGTVGSGGSLCGTAATLKQRVPGVRIVAVDAVGSVLFHQPNRKRLQGGHSNSIIPGNVNYRVLDEVHWVSDGEAFNACRELTLREGIFAGGSSGAVYVVASWLAEQLGPEKNVVAILPDRGDRYADTIYSDRYFQEHKLMGIEAAEHPLKIRYGVDVAERWSWAALPHDGSVPYHAPEAVTSGDLTRQLELP